ncbi:hypothetical protein GZ180_07420, partial [Dermatophilus congolensis]
RIGATAAIIDTTSLPPATITTLITGNSDNTPEITITTLTTTGETQTTTPANLTELANNYELILLATPPHPASAHSQLLTATANTTLLVVPLTTHKNDLNATLAALHPSDENLIYILATDTPDHH